MKNQHCIKWIGLLGAFCLSTSVLAATTPAAPAKPTKPVASTPAETASFSPEQVENIQKIVHNYLVKHPDVLVEASQALQKQTEAKQQSLAMTAIKQNIKQLFNNPGSPTLGNPNGSIVLVEFYDYQCGHCKEMNKVLQAVLKSNKNVKLVLKEFPIFGANSKYAAQASLASAKQGKLAAFHEALLAASNPLSNEKVLAVAKQVGLDLPQLKKDMNSTAVTNELMATFKLAQALHIAGTPTFVISNKDQTQFAFIPGATTQANLEKELSEVSS